MNVSQVLILVVTILCGALFGFVSGVVIQNAIPGTGGFALSMLVAVVGGFVIGGVGANIAMSFDS